MTNNELKQHYMNLAESRVMNQNNLFDISLLCLSALIIILGAAFGILLPIIFAALSIILTLVSFRTAIICYAPFLKVIEQRFSDTPNIILEAEQEQLLKIWMQVTNILRYASGIFFAAALLTFIIELVV